MKKGKIFYGWRIVIALWLIYFLSFPMIAYGTSILTIYMVEDLKLNEALIGWSSSAFYGGQMAFSIAVGILNEKKGFRFSQVVGCTIIMLGCFCMYLLRIPAMLYIILFFVLGASCLLSGIITGPALVNAWFDLNKFGPMSIFMTAGALGGFVIPMISERLADWIGWQKCWGLYAIFAMIAAIIAYLFVKDRPEDVGEVRDGIRWRKAHYLSIENEKEDQAEHLTIIDILKDKKLWHFCIVIFGVRLLFSAFISYFVFFTIKNGVSTTMAAIGLSLFHIFGMAGRLLAGIRIRVPVNIVNSIVYMGMAIGGGMLSVAYTIPGFFAAAIIMGICHNYAYTYLAVQIPIYFGNDNYAAYFGIINTVGSVGNTLGPMIVSTCIIFCGYRGIFMILSIVTVVCAGLSFSLRPPLNKRRW